MKTAGTLLAVGLAVAGIALTGPVSAKEFVYGSWVSPKHGTNTAGLMPFFKELEKESGGAIKWKLLAGGQVVGARTTLPGIRDKLVDAGFLVQVFNRRDLKANNTVFDMQAFGDDPVAVGGAATETIMLDCPACQREYKKYNTVYLAGFGITPFHMMCRDDLRRVEQFEGKKIRAVTSCGTG